MPRYTEVAGAPPTSKKEYPGMSINRTSPARKHRSDILWIGLSALCALALWPGLYLYALATMPTN